MSRCTDLVVNQIGLLYDLLMYSLSDIDEESLKGNHEKIKKSFVDLCQLDEFQRTISAGLQNRSSILKRRQLWKDLLNSATSSES